MPRTRTFLVSLLICAFSDITIAQDPDGLRSRAEVTSFEETSRYDDVLDFLTKLQQRSPFLRMDTLGFSQEGRRLPLMILSDPPVSTPLEASQSKKPIVFIMANIHAGEVEGKEAVQHLARRVLLGDLQPVLSKLTILIAPIFNADGNEKTAPENRAEQFGPIGGVGVRTNSQTFDLNRDFIKLESPEVQSLVKFLNLWDPHLTVDLHTTNGSYHAYHLTYSHPLNPNTDKRILTFQRDQMVPTIADAMLTTHNFRTYYYGNFTGNSKKPQPGDRTTWEAFTHQPRIGQNYGGLRNRLTVLSEAYSYLSFQRRIEVTERFVEEILRYCADHASQIVELTRAADDETVRRFSGNETVDFGVAFRPIPLARPVEILVGEVESRINPRSGKEMTVMVEDRVTPMMMEDFGMFAATRSVQAPRAYLLAYDRNIVEKCLQHGITVEKLTADLTTEVEGLVIGSIEKSTRPFQGHFETKITGEYTKSEMTFPTDSILVRTAQPLGMLVCYLLEPESEDGLVTWNFFDSYLKVGTMFPVYKLMSQGPIASVPVEK